ncbi:hypothetical protein [Niastella populi]|nr:hypothetical protein [Niastella populi]
MDLGKHPSFRFPAFCIETEFIVLFTHIIDRSGNRNNVVPFLDALIKKAFEQSVDEISDLLDEHNISGAAIFSLICEKKLIRNREKKALHKKLPGKAKNLVDSYVNGYNNWLLAHILWKAYIQSHDPDYSFGIPKGEDAPSSEAFLYDPQYKPLWALKQAYIEAGRPTHGHAGDDIFIRPIAAWYQLQKKRKTGKAQNTKHIK